MPDTDWLWASSGGPTRRASSRPSVQYDADAPGMSAKPTATVATNASTARPAADRRPTRTSSTTNTSGVSFRPATIPTSTPDVRRSGCRTSTRTASISKALIWPKARFCHTGSIAIAAVAARATSHPGAGRPSAWRTTTTDAATHAALAPVHSAAASQPGTSASGTITTAANGG